MARDRTTRPVSHRRRFLIGLALAALLGVGLGAVLLAGAQAAERHERAERRAVVTLSALAALVDRAGGGAPAAASTAAAAAETPAPPAEGGMGLGAEIAAAEQAPAAASTGDQEGAVRGAVQAFAAAHPEIAAIRVVEFEGLLLAASTALADRGAQAAPRRLEHDEKPLFDLGQKLRAAVEGNRQGAEGAARAPELGFERRPDGVLALAAPVERGGEVVGMVQMETRATPEPPSFSWLPFLAAWLAPVIALLLLSFVLGDRPWPLAAASALLLLLALFLFGRYATGQLKAERLASARSVAAQIGEEGKRAETLLADVKAPAGPPLAPATWDADGYRQPRGLIDVNGAPNQARLAELGRLDSGRMIRSVATLALLALLLLAFVGFGWAWRTGAALVEYRAAYTYVLPAMIGMLILVFFPFFYGIALSFTNLNIYNSDKAVFEIWVGFQNYLDIISDFHVMHRTAEGLVWNYQNFYYTLAFTIAWTVANVAIGTSLGLALALTLNLKNFALRPLYRVLLILPWAMPNYITALIFKGMFHRQFGVINQILQLVGLAPVGWFDHPFTSFLAVLTTNGWLSFPFMMVISLGALQSIPTDLYEAARVDGASRWQQFRSITLPSLKPALVPAIILSVIWTFNQFNVIYLVSAGDPGGATEILITQSYKLAFEQYRYGYAAAYSTIIFLILLAYGTWQNRVTGATEAIG
ncbi:MAG TPA: sugar ABC transporter permease [Thermoanaerobaculia bacterium]|jgi:arabinogalactan oligomer/maltooligosaccharide transport system permease protein